MKKINSMSKVIAITLFIIIATLAINIYLSFSDIIYIESVFDQMKNKLIYTEEINQLQDNSSVLIEFNLNDLEIEYGKYKLQGQMKIITNVLVLMIAFISVGTIQNLINSIETKQDLTEDIEHKINQYIAKDNLNLLRKEVPK